jgi:hypothetical protein
MEPDFILVVFLLSWTRSAFLALFAIKTVWFFLASVINIFRNTSNVSLVDRLQRYFVVVVEWGLVALKMLRKFDWLTELVWELALADLLALYSVIWRTGAVDCGFEAGNLLGILLIPGSFDYLALLTHMTSLVAAKSVKRGVIVLEINGSVQNLPWVELLFRVVSLDIHVEGLDLWNSYSSFVVQVRIVGKGVIHSHFCF